MALRERGRAGPVFASGRRDGPLFTGVYRGVAMATRDYGFQPRVGRGKPRQHGAGNGAFSRQALRAFSGPRPGFAPARRTARGSPPLRLAWAC